jgi:prepilin-type processing-associated H-X9-DG protein
MRRGLTLIEVIVVVVIVIGVAILLLPAVSKVRIASLRVNCQNNLKQLGIACHNYASANNDHFPPGTLPNPVLAPEERLSFHVPLLPYVENEKLYALLAKTETWDSDRNVGLVAHRAFKLYQCPYWLAINDYDANLVGSGHLAFTHYVGVAGTGADAVARPGDAPGVGIFGYDRTVKIKDVKDGTENTALMLETVHEVGPWMRGGPSTVRAVDAGAQFGGTHPRTSMWGKKHDNGFNLLLADGSVRHTKPDIDPAVLAALATVAGGEEISANW